MIYKIEKNNIQIMPNPTVKKYGLEPENMEFREPTNKDYLDLLKEKEELEHKFNIYKKEVSKHLKYDSKSLEEILYNNAEEKGEIMLDASIRIDLIKEDCNFIIKNIEKKWIKFHYKNKFRQLIKDLHIEE